MDEPLEDAPTDEQKERLENWLVELMLLARRYQILLESDGDDVRVLDVKTSTCIGLGLSPLVDVVDGRDHVRAYDVTHSILDGMWPVSDPDGRIVEQRTLGSVWTRRDMSEMPS